MGVIMRSGWERSATVGVIMRGNGWGRSGCCNEGKWVGEEWVYKGEVGGGSGCYNEDKWVE